MWVWLLKNWKSVLSCIGTGSVIIALAIPLHNCQMDKAEKSKNEAVKAEKAAGIKQCNADKAVTQEVANGYEDAISALNGQLRSLELRLNVSKCAVVANAAGQHNGAPTVDLVPGQDDGRAGLNPAWLIQYAGDAERVRLQLKSCQDFIRKAVK